MPEMAARFRGVVAAEVGGLADFGNAVVERLAALMGEQRDQAVAVLLDQVGRALERRRALFGRRRFPRVEAGDRRLDGVRRDATRPPSPPCRRRFAGRRATSPHRRRPPCGFPAMSGAPPRSEARPRATPRVSASRSARLPNSIPREFLRSPKRRSGNGRSRHGAARRHPQSSRPAARAGSRPARSRR